MNKTLAVLIVVLCIASCGTSKKSATAQAPVNDTITDLSFRKIMKDKELYASTTEVVPLDTIYIMQDTLHLLTKKITGCESENFRLMWNGAMMKSLPPQVPVKLFELLPPDCKEQHYFHLTYNIKPIRMKQDSATAAIDTASKTILVRIAGWKNAVKYEY